MRPATRTHELEALLCRLQQRLADLKAWAKENRKS